MSVRRTCCAAPQSPMNASSLECQTAACVAILLYLTFSYSETRSARGWNEPEKSRYVKRPKRTTRPSLCRPYKKIWPWSYHGLSHGNTIMSELTAVEAGEPCATPLTFPNGLDSYTPLTPLVTPLTLRTSFVVGALAANASSAAASSSAPLIFLQLQRYHFVLQ